MTEKEFESIKKLKLILGFGSAALFMVCMMAYALVMKDYSDLNQRKQDELTQLKAELIEKGMAQYNPGNGQFELLPCIDHYLDY